MGGREGGKKKRKKNEREVGRRKKTKREANQKGRKKKIVKRQKHTKVAFPGHANIRSRDIAITIPSKIVEKDKFHHKTDRVG